MLRVEGVSKRFGSVVALRDVNMHLGRGEVLGLVGDNAAGKSTLVKILTGYHTADRGRLFIDGREERPRSVDEARRLGIETMFQDLALVNELSVAQNLFLNRELLTGGALGFLCSRRMRVEARQYLEEVGIDIPSVDSPVEKLSGGQRQAIAVARATRVSGVKVLLLDEPLAAMGAKEGAMVIELIKKLARARGVSMMVIDHNYAHIFEICDRVNVLQQGHIILNRPVKDMSLGELTEFVVASYRRRVLASQRQQLLG